MAEQIESEPSQENISTDEVEVDAELPPYRANVLPGEPARVTAKWGDNDKVSIKETVEKKMVKKQLYIAGIGIWNDRLQKYQYKLKESAGEPVKYYANGSLYAENKIRPP